MFHPAAAMLACFAAAGQQFHLPPKLLESVSYVESSHNPSARNVNTNGTVDIGAMAINSSWLPALKEMGISRSQLDDACTNIQVGAWILSQTVSRYGYSWFAIGAYNAGPLSKKSLLRKIPLYKSYSQKVLVHWKQLEALSQAAPAPAGHMALRKKESREGGDRYLRGAFAVRPGFEVDGRRQGMARTESPATPIVDDEKMSRRYTW